MKWLQIKEQRLKLLADQRGYILGMVMVFFVVFSILGLSFIKMGSHERIHAFKDYNREKAYYYARSGIHKGLWRINKVSKAAGTFSDSTVSVVYDSVGLTLTVTGTSGTAQKISFKSRSKKRLMSLPAVGLTRFTRIRKHLDWTRGRGP